MGTWGGAERVVQPTDQGQVGFRVSEGDHEGRQEDERGTRAEREGLVVMKYRLYRLFITLSAIGAIVLAGGASAKGW